MTHSLLTLANNTAICYNLIDLDGWWFYYWGDDLPICYISGSDDCADWWTNGLFRLHNNWHYGHYVVATNILADIGQVPEETLFVGHSLGGSVAHLCALLTNNKAISFGSPKMFKANLAEEDHLFVELRFDPITWLNLRQKPSTLVLPGFGHKMHHYIREIETYATKTPELPTTFHSPAFSGRVI